MTIDTNSFPRLNAISSGLLFLKRAFVYTGTPLRPEMVLVPTDEDGDLRTGVVAFTAQWNAYWEAGPYRPEALQDKVPHGLRALERFADRHVDVVLVPVDAGSDYGAYAPLYHLLPHRLLIRHGLPIIVHRWHQRPFSRDSRSSSRPDGPHDSEPFYKFFLLRTTIPSVSQYASRWDGPAQAPIDTVQNAHASAYGRVLGRRTRAA